MQLGATWPASSSRQIPSLWGAWRFQVILGPDFLWFFSGWVFSCACLLQQMWVCWFFLCHYSNNLGPYVKSNKKMLFDGFFLLSQKRATFFPRKTCTRTQVARTFRMHLVNFRNSKAAKNSVQVLWLATACCPSGHCHWRVSFGRPSW